VLTQDQIDAFHQDGVLIIRRLLDDEHVAALQAAVDATTARGLAGDGPGHAYRTVEGEARYYRTDGVWEYDRAYRMAAMQPKILAVVGQLLGRPFMPINDSIVVKLPRSGVPVPWHQDPPYGGVDGRATTFKVPNFDIDIYLDRATIESGCLYAITGHHLVGHVELERFTENELFERPDAIALEMSPGDVLVHCSSAPHGSRANESDAPRRVVYFHYMAREVLETLLWDWALAKRAHTPHGLPPTEAFQTSGFAWAGAMLAEAGTTDEIGAQQVVLGAAGFEFIGQPVTPRDHWQVLIDRISPEEQATRRALVAEGANRFAHGISAQVL
jgi:ectoine hydroxylase-related dioxygenase (phytanoyl-CoA dioxygenase family)